MEETVEEGMEEIQEEGEEMEVEEEMGEEVVDRKKLRDFREVKGDGVRFDDFPRRCRDECLHSFLRCLKLY